MTKNLNTPSAEYHIIKSLSHCLSYSGKTSFKLGIGDDAALRICKEGEQLIFTADILVEDVHFSLDYMALDEIGYKAMVANISDCAAMGSIPDSASIQLVFPRSKSNIKEDILQLYQGIDKASLEYNFPIIGGDLSVGDKWIIGVSMTGRKSKDERLLFRKGAQVGDDLWVTGTLGGSAAGLAILRRYGRSDAHDTLIQKHISPKAKVNDALRLSTDQAVTTLTDISDGIGKECRTLAYEGNFTVEVRLTENLMLPETLSLSKEIGVNPYEWVVNGGEDYELLFTASPNFDDKNYADLSLIKIGKIVKSGYDVIFNSSGLNTYSNLGLGWDHLKNQ